MINTIRKRSGEVVAFQPEKITRAIYKAAVAVGGSDWGRAEELTEQVVVLANAQFPDGTAEVEKVQDLVEKVLIENGHAKTSKAYILYREKRRSAREANALIGATIDMFSKYMGDGDWRVKENANAQKSIAGMNNYIRETFTKQYWLHEIYPDKIRDAHLSGDLHLHDLGFFGPYCAGWDLKQLLLGGFGGVPGKVESSPAKHLRSFLGQIVNSTFTTQGETAGAQAWSSFDTYCAPFIRYDHLDFATVKQALQEFIFNLNVPTRVGFQCPFSNLTFDIKPPRTLRDQAVIIGGQPMDATYGEFQAEMDMLNLAFCEVMMEGDKKGRVFTFPIPTINVTKDFEWDSPVVNKFMEITCKYGIPYFSNYINSDLSPEDALSMCCRLRLNTGELRKRGGGLFGSNPLTGSIGVVTVNLPRIGYLSRTEEEFKSRLLDLMEIAKESLEIKRKTIEEQTRRGMYPYSAHYLENVKERTGSYWFNHFNTIGLIGMNEACLNFMGKDITTPEGQRFSLDILDFMRDTITRFQEETGHVYNLEATPAEGTSYSLAQLDRKKYPDIITAGQDAPYYTNSTQLPVGFTDDIFETLDLQDELQCKYTGGTVLHLYLGEQISDVEVAKSLIRKAFTNYQLPYISLTPTFSVCPEHGYLNGEVYSCPECGHDTEVWSRVVGYLRPVQNFHRGKREEYKERKKYRIKPEELSA
ncbi:ribonucleoside triphosphate reductase [Anaerotruncus massiliensis (ex Liu et al. 2021)]|uniref:Ribonucleoside triphosphate reductase n=3 Tax=Anaerotruncus TaxID=244127 RepID=A0A498CRA7_9FIRM|nr:MULTISPECIES: ribonucleoside triphosphate reductase [Anaerotruncus]MBC3937710.1 ribonucleoside triphosphate reductase [Anaerotruncus massiliensis (ex Togo et al. 2019)]RLL14815.1 ribonucleoside triphosphate reductase [Anaerotruncus massiliensis (ex Liu et al. 2021)]